MALNWACAMRGQLDVVLGTHLHKVALNGVTAWPLDLEGAGRFDLQLAEIAPDIIVHTAGLTSVDQCEEDPVAARHVNAELARTVAEAASRRHIKLVHISTDHLFAGTRSFYREGDPPDPLNQYAKSKLLAEQWVLKANPEALVLRTNFFGWGHAGRQSFSDWIIAALRTGKPLAMFDDVYFTPILADELAKAAHCLVEKGAEGIFNLVGDERLSKHEFATRLATALGLPGGLIRHDKISTVNLKAPRPRDMSLDNAKASDLLGDGLGRIDDYFVALLRQENEGRRDELFQAVTE